MNLVERYKGGQYEEVWKELIMLGEEVRNPEILPLAQDVARNAMVTVRRNIEELIKRWQAKDFVFGYNWIHKRDNVRAKGEPPILAKPTHKEIELLDKFEKEFGPLPIVLRAFYEIVGAVNFVGQSYASDYPWPEPAQQLFDPLFIYGFEADESLCEGIRRHSKVQKVVFPDPLVKFFYGGVGDISTTIPSRGFDAVLFFEGEPMHYKGEVCYLGNYLREIILHYGGLGIDDTYLDKIFVESLRKGLHNF